MARTGVVEGRPETPVITGSDLGPVSLAGAPSLMPAGPRIPGHILARTSRRLHDCSRHAPIRNRRKLPRLPLPQTPFKSAPVVEDFRRFEKRAFDGHVI